MAGGLGSEWGVVMVTIVVFVLIRNEPSWEIECHSDGISKTGTTRALQEVCLGTFCNGRNIIFSTITSIYQQGVSPHNRTMPRFPRVVHCSP